MPLGEKADLLVGLTKTMQAVDGVALARANLSFWDTDKWFVSSQGHRISQHIVESGGGMDATAVGESETQLRSYPQSFGQYETGGYEVIRRFDLPGHAERIGERGRRPAHRARSARRRPPTSSSRAASSPCRSTSRWATPSSSTASSAGRRPTPAPRSSTCPARRAALRLAS